MFVLILNRHFTLYTTTPRLNNSTAPFADGLDLVQGGFNNRRWGLSLGDELCGGAGAAGWSAEIFSVEAGVPRHLDAPAPVRAALYFSRC